MKRLRPFIVPLIRALPFGSLFLRHVFPHKINVTDLVDRRYVRQSNNATVSVYDMEQEVYDWIAESRIWCLLEHHWLRLDKETEQAVYQLLFRREKDLILFKMRWM